MNLFTRIASATLGGLCALGAASAAYAHHLPRQPFVEAETASLMRSAQAAGISIFSDKDPSTRGQCRAGLFGMANNRKQLLICVKNHRGDMVELADTVRHELIHNVQYCKGGLVYPHLKDKNLAFARDYLHMPMDKYSPASYYREAEARTLAHVLEEDRIAELVTRYCK